jgi:hypothetical protein
MKLQPVIIEENELNKTSNISPPRKKLSYPHQNY